MLLHASVHSTVAAALFELHGNRTEKKITVLNSPSLTQTMAGSAVGLLSILRVFRKVPVARQPHNNLTVR